MRLDTLALLEDLLRASLAGYRLELAEYWIEYKEWGEALAQLLEIVQRDRAFEDDVGRKRMVQVFELAATQPAVVSEWRRRLGAALNVR